MRIPGTLLVPDIHQNYRFLENILERETSESIERVVLLGDYFDSRELAFRGPGAARKTARLIYQLEATLGNRLTLLWGNHDVPYYLYQSSSDRSVKCCLTLRRLSQQMGLAPESELAADAVCEEWPPAFWEKLRPFAQIGGYVLSHAGIHRSHFPEKARSAARSLKTLDGQWSEGLVKLRAGKGPDPLMDAGTARGGEHLGVGGITWLDWDREFVDDLPFCQIVGHSWCPSRRKVGRSHCIDYGQCAYAVLGRELEVRWVPTGSS